VRARDDRVSERISLSENATASSMIASVSSVGRHCTDGHMSRGIGVQLAGKGRQWQFGLERWSVTLDFIHMNGKTLTSTQMFKRCNVNVQR
jgi:hypothetical protein